jgi:hypothetical protein
MAIHGGHMEDGCSLFFPHFWGIENFGEIMPGKKKHWMGASRTR